MFGTVALSEHPFVFLSFSATCTLSIPKNVVALIDGAVASRDRVLFF
jgi:hypothetical protein